MTRASYLSFLAARADGQPARRKPESIRPHDPLLAMRLQREIEAAEATDDQARAALKRAV